MAFRSPPSVPVSSKAHFGSTILIALLSVCLVRADSYSHLDSKTRSLIRELKEKYQDGTRYLPGYGLRDTQSSDGLPRVFAPTRPRTTYTKYPWKRNIVTTIFWIGEKPTENNPTPNTASSWDTKWEESYGGYDDPDRSNRTYFRPKGFIPQQNPFYVALPYNDIHKGITHKETAKKVIPWFKDRYVNARRSVVKGRWIAIRFGARICYAQWEDVGPFETDDWEYVFGDRKPKTTSNKGAGLDISPAVRDFLAMRSGQRCDWRFVELEEVPTGPWRELGKNNPFVIIREQNLKAGTATSSESERLVKSSASGIRTNL